MTHDEFHPRKIRIYKNGDEYFMGKRIILNERIYRSYEQFILSMSKEIDLKSGAVRRIYDMNGKQMRALEELENGCFYVASSGEPFKRVNYATEENGLPLSVNSNRNLALPLRTDTRGRRHINGSTGGLLEDDPKLHDTSDAIFTPTSKAYKIGVFENGDVNAQSMKLILNYRNCKNFEQLLKFLSSHITLKTGQVRKIYDAQTGKRIRSLHDLEPGHNIVVASHEPFKRGTYQIQNLVPQIPREKRQYTPGKVVTFFPNGDSYHSGFNLTISRRRFPTISRVLDHLNTQIELVTGKIQKIYNMDGNRLTSIEEFEKGKGYVLVANDDPFIKTRYNILAVSYKQTMAPLHGYSLKNEYMDKIRPVTNRKKKPMEARQFHYDHEKYDGVSKKVNPTTPRRRIESEIESGLDTDRESVPRKPKTARPKQEIEEEENIRHARGEEEVYGEERVQVMESKKKSKQVPSRPASGKQDRPQSTEKPKTANRKKEEEFEAELVPVQKQKSKKPQTPDPKLSQKPQTPDPKLSQKPTSPDPKQKPMSPEPKQNEKRPQTTDKRPTTSDKRPTTGDSDTRPQTTEKRPTTSDKKSKPTSPEPLRSRQQSAKSVESEEFPVKSAEKSPALSRAVSPRDKTLKFQSKAEIKSQTQLPNKSTPQLQKDKSIPQLPKEKSTADLQKARSSSVNK